MALLTLSNGGAPAHLFHLMEAPTMRLPNVKILLCWPSRKQIYGFVENHTFWSNLLAWGYQHNFPIWGYQHIFGALDWCMSFHRILWIIGNLSDLHMPGYDTVQIDGGEHPGSSESRLFAIERSEMSERRAPSEDGDGCSP